MCKGGSNEQERNEKSHHPCLSTKATYDGAADSNSTTAPAPSPWWMMEPFVTSFCSFRAETWSAPLYDRSQHYSKATSQKENDETRIGVISPKSPWWRFFKNLERSNSKENSLRTVLAKFQTLVPEVTYRLVNS